MATIIDLWPSNTYLTYVHAIPGVGSANFRTVDFGSAFFNLSYYVLRVLSDTLVSRCMIFEFFAFCQGS